MTPILELNLASRPFRNNTHLWLAYGLGAALVVLLTAWNVRAAIDQADRLAVLEDALATADTRLQDLEARDERAAAAIAKFDLDALVVQTRKANDVIDRRALSWTRLFNLLEGIQPYEVRMVSIRPVYAGRDARIPGVEAVPEGTVPVKVDGAAQSLEAFLEFERALLLDPHFARVEPERTQSIPSGEVVFTLDFLYDPEGRLGSGGDVTLPPILPAVAQAEAEAREAAKRLLPSNGETPAEAEGETE